MEKSVLLEKRKELEALVLNTQDEYVKFASYCNLYDLPSDVQEKIMKVYEEIVDNVEYVQKGNVRYIPLEKLSNDYRYVFDALVKMNGAMKIDVTKNIPTFIKKYNSEEMYNMVNASGIEYTEAEKAYIANQVKFETDYITFD